MSKPDPPGRPRVALIAGPTASGKSALALALAEAGRGTIINADASQVYADLAILTARPSAADEAGVPHLLYGYRDAARACSAADWALDAKAAIDATLAAGRLPIVVGGTGLYLRTLIDGIAPVPEIDPAIRAAIRALPPGAAHAALASEDAAAHRRLHPNDTGRSQRALEVVRATGRTLAAWQARRAGGIAATCALDIRLVDVPPAELRLRIAARVERMIADGAIEEVARLVARGLDPALPAMRAIGVRPLIDHLAGRRTIAETIEEIARSTRAYAKRQRTWFRHQSLSNCNDWLNRAV